MNNEHAIKMHLIPNNRSALRWINYKHARIEIHCINICSNWAIIRIEFYVFNSCTEIFQHRFSNSVGSWKKHFIPVKTSNWNSYNYYEFMNVHRCDEAILRFFLQIGIKRWMYLKACVRSRIIKPVCSPSFRRLHLMNIEFVSPFHYYRSFWLIESKATILLLIYDYMSMNFLRETFAVLYTRL